MTDDVSADLSDEERKLNAPFALVTAPPTVRRFGALPGRGLLSGDAAAGGWRMGPLTAAVALALVVGVAGGAAGLHAHLTTTNNNGAAGSGGWPSARTGAVLVGDTSTGTVILFGGRSAEGATMLDDTWSWDGTAWTQFHPAHSPAARESAAAAYDAATKRVVIFGGVTMSPAPSPSPAGNACPPVPQPMPAQPPKGMPMMPNGATPGVRAGASGGSSGGAMMPNCGGFTTVKALGDTWTWDGGDWTAQPAASGPAAGPGTVSMAYDEARSEIVMVGSVATPGAAAPGMCVRAGGSGSAGSGSTSISTPASGVTAPAPASAGSGTAPPGPIGTACVMPALAPATWTGDGTHWTIHRSDPGTSSFPSPSVVYDPVAKAVRSFETGCAVHAGGGVGIQMMPPTAANGDATQKGGPAMMYPCAYGSASASVQGSASISAGPIAMPPCRATGCPASAGHVHTWDGSAWRSQELTGPIPGSAGSVSQDSSHSLVMVAPTTPIAMYRFDGTGWNQIHLATSPGTPGGAIIAWDAAHSRVLLFGGDVNGSVATTLWAWDGAAWTKAGGVTPPAPTAMPAVSGGPVPPCPPIPMGPGPSVLPATTGASGAVPAVPPAAPVTSATGTSPNAPSPPTACPLTVHPMQPQGSVTGGSVGAPVPPSGALSP